MSLQSRLLDFLDLRSRIVLTFFGLAFLFWGFHELRVGAGATLEVVELSRLEEGYLPATPYLQIGKHLCRYEALVYSTKESLPERPSTKVEYSLVPIAVPGKDNAGKSAAEGSKAGKVTVVIKTTRFREMRDFPEHDQIFGGVQGVLIHEVEQLSQEEKNLLFSIAPHAPHELWVLEEGREPWSLSAVAGMMSVGGALLLIVVGVTILDARRGGPPVIYELATEGNRWGLSSSPDQFTWAKVDLFGLMLMGIVHALAGITTVCFLLALTTLNPCLIGGSVILAAPFNFALWTQFRTAGKPDDIGETCGLRRKTWLIVLGISYGLGVLAASWLGFSLRG